jgi:hypothetical protein
VRYNLVELLRTHHFINEKWHPTSEYREEKWERMEVLPPQAYEIAEALWGEYSEELF